MSKKIIKSNMEKELDIEGQYNKTIINEFEKLVRFVRQQIKENKEKGNVKESTANTFRLKQISGALKTIKAYPNELTVDNLNDIAKYPGIGKGTIDRIKQIILTGYLEELKDWDDPEGKIEPIITELESIVGVGRATAVELISKGIKSVEDLKKKVEKGEITLNDKIMLGIKYHNKFFGDIPRDEITSIKGVINEVITKLNKKNKNKYIFEICGSYRRGKPISGDIDVLITREKDEKSNDLEKIIKELKSPIKSNDMKPLLIDDMTENVETKYMGFAQYKNNKVRRIDIRYIPQSSYYTALLYFTGSAELNKRMRQIAKKMGYKLSEYSVENIEDGSIIPITSEKDVFDLLDMGYLEPSLR